MVKRRERGRAGCPKYLGFGVDIGVDVEVDVDIEVDVEVDGALCERDGDWGVS